MISEKHRKQLEKVHERNRIHGMTGTPIYYVWAQMFQRCYNEKNKHFMLYGKRGISVCDQWKDFSLFNKWAKENGYQIGLTIDRKNNDGNYEPNNCRWVTQKVQTNNHRRNRIIEFNGETKTLSQWCEYFNIPHWRIYDRLYRQNWSPEKAFLTPKKNINDKKSQYRKKIDINS